MEPGIVVSDGIEVLKDTSILVSVEIDDYNFEVVKDFVYLGCSINTDIDICLEIRRRITLANRCYFGLSKQLSKKALSGERRFVYTSLSYCRFYYMVLRLGR